MPLGPTYTRQAERRMRARTRGESNPNCAVRMRQQVDAFAFFAHDGEADGHGVEDTTSALAFENPLSSHEGRSRSPERKVGIGPVLVLSMRAAGAFALV